MIKKIISILIMVCMVLSICSCTINEEDETNSKNDTNNEEIENGGEFLKGETIDGSDVLASDNEVLKGYRNIAIFGVDSRDNSYGPGNRSDNIMIASINKKTGEVRLISVYRDTYLKMDHTNGKSILDKATHSYSYNTATGAIKMLNENLDLNITEYITVNFKALIDAVDFLGGVEILVTADEIVHINNYIDESNAAYDGDSPKLTETGKQNLDGIQALSYCRVRYTAGGDFKRTERLRDLLMAIVEKLKTLPKDKITEFIETMLPEDEPHRIATNLTATDIISLVPSIAKFNITKSIGWPYDTLARMINGTSYVVPNTLEEGVRRLHVEIFDDAEYVVPEGIKKISQDIMDASQKKPETNAE